MSKFAGPRGKVVRRFGVNVFGNPKFDRLLAKRPNKPGVHGPTKGRRKVSEYGLQQIEKQKLKYMYGVGESQFRVIFQRALRKRGITGDNLMILLESRLDNVVYRMGMAPSRAAARQFILHGHMKVNGRRTNIPSFCLHEGDILTIKDSSRSRALASRYMEENMHRPTPTWVTVDKEALRTVFVRPPMRSEIEPVANEQLVVELYSK